MKNMKLVFGVFLLFAVTSTHAQIGPLTVINIGLGVANFVGKVAKGGALLACHITNLQNPSVKEAFFSVVFNKNSPNETRCLVGCTVTALYIGRNLVRKITHVDLMAPLNSTIGPELYSAVEGCLEETKNEKCAFFITYGRCLVPKVLPILERDIGMIAAKVIGTVANLTKNAVRDVTNNLGNILPLAKPIFDQINVIIDNLIKLIPFQTQPALGGATNTTATNPFASAIQQFFAKVLNLPTTTTSTTSTTTIPTTTTTIPTTTTTTTTTTTSTTPKPTTKKVDLIGDGLNFFGNFLKNIG